jgi:hypothetical protein
VHTATARQVQYNLFFNSTIVSQSQLVVTLYSHHDVHVVDTHHADVHGRHYTLDCLSTAHIAHTVVRGTFGQEPLLWSSSTVSGCLINNKQCSHLINPRMLIIYVCTVVRTWAEPLCSPPCCQQIVAHQQ